MSALIRPSGIATFERCASKWHFDAVQGIRQLETPAMRAGTEIHAHVAAWLNARTEPPADAKGDAARALIAAIPPPEAALGVECSWVWPDAGMRGTIDMLYQDPDGVLVVGDHKTRSDLKWCPNDLTGESQVRAYALALSQAVGVDTVRVRHHNVTRAKPHHTRLVDATLHAPEHMPWLVDVVRRMRDAAETPIAGVDWEPGACGDYASYQNPDGCAYRARCLALGRPVGGAAAKFYPEADMGYLADRLRQLDPDAVVPHIEGDVHGTAKAVSQALAACLTARMALLTEVRALGVAIPTDAEVTLPELRATLAMLRPIEPPQGRAAVLAEIKRLRPDLDPPAEVSDADLLAGLHDLQAEAAESAIADGQTDPPDRASDTPPMVPVPPAPTAQVLLDSSGYRLPARYGGGYVSAEKSNTGMLQAFLRDHNVPIPKTLRDTRAAVLAHLAAHPTITATIDVPAGATITAQSVAPRVEPQASGTHTLQEGRPSAGAELRLTNPTLVQCAECGELAESSPCRDCGTSGPWRLFVDCAPNKGHVRHYGATAAPGAFRALRDGTWRPLTGAVCVDTSDAWGLALAGALAELAVSEAREIVLVLRRDRVAR